MRFTSARSTGNIVSDEEKAPSFPAGTFTFRADWQSVSHGLSAGESPTEQISIRLVVLDEYPDVRGKSILWFGNFSSQMAMDITIKALVVMGWDGKSRIGKPDGENGFLAGLGGTEFEAVIRHETYRGKTRAKVAFVNAKGAGFDFKEPLSGGALDKLNERVRRHMASTGPREAGPPPPVGGRATPPPTSGGYRPRIEPPMSDEQRARMIDQGREEPPMSSGGAAGGASHADDDIPF